MNAMKHGDRPRSKIDFKSGFRTYLLVTFFIRLHTYLFKSP